MVEAAEGCVAVFVDACEFEFVVIDEVGVAARCVPPSLTPSFPSSWASSSIVI